MAANIREVARLAGVSVATVSRVTTGNAAVADSTRQRVETALNSLNYVPSRLGRALSSKKHDSCGIVFPALGGPMFAGILKGFAEELQRGGTYYNILVPHDSADTATQIADLTTRIDGLCVFGDVVGGDELARIASMLPVVRIAGTPDARFGRVAVSNREASRELTEHLIATHHVNDIAFLGQTEFSPDVYERYEGYQDALAAHGLKHTARHIRSPLTQTDALLSVVRLIDEGSLPRGLVCASDEIAVGAYLACQGREVKVPHDIALVGFDDIVLARHVTPSLTTAAQPFEEMGQAAARLLADGGAKRAEAAAFTSRMVTRGSCGCAKRASPH